MHDKNSRFSIKVSCIVKKKNTEHNVIVHNTVMQIKFNFILSKIT